MNSKENNIQESLISNDSNQENSSKNSSMTEIKNMFDINNNSNSNESNIFHNSVKIFKKQNLTTNPESSLKRTKSNKHITEQTLINNKNFPEKANYYKGNTNNNSNAFDPPKSSPIVQYFHQFFKASNPESSPTSQCFDFSPSQIFNKDKIIPEMVSKYRKSIESLNLNNQSEDKNAIENYIYDPSKYDISYNDESETNFKKEDEKTSNGNENTEIDNKINKIENGEKNKENIENSEIKGNELNNKNEINDNRDLPIQNAIEQLRKKKNKNAENLLKEEGKENIKEQANIKENIIYKQDKQEETTKNYNDQKNLENEETLVTNVLNNLEEESFLFDVKNKSIKNIDDNTGNEIEEQKINSESKILSTNDTFINNNKINNNFENKKMNNLNNFNYIKEKKQNNPNLINNNLINNNLFNNYNNAYIQYNYTMNNINQNPNINLMMMNKRQNPINNNTINNINNNYFPYNNMFNINNNSNNFNNYNYNLSQIMNNNLPLFNNNTNNNNNNFDLQRYNQILQNSGNINIQNNYFLYNNNNNNNQENRNDKNKINIKDEKQKKKKKRKIKKLEQESYMNKPINYYLDNFMAIAKDQGASRYLQNNLNNFLPQEINSFFDPLCKNIMQLINDPFANYLIQKIICYFTQEQLLNLLNILTPYFFEISCNNHGTRVLQKIIDLTKTSELRKLFYDLIHPKVFELLKDLNGTYIVQKFVGLNLDEYGLKINSIIIENSVELCKNRHGCCVIQKYLETRDPYMLPDLVYKLLDGFSSLITDQFGNYVIKTILVMGNPEYSNKIGEQIYDNILFYSKHKYSSNIVEKCFDFCQGVFLNKLLGKIQQEQNLKDLILDEHGNYVVQKVLAVSNTKKKKEMLYIIRGLFPKLKKTHFGERIIQRISATYPYIYNL